MQRGDIYDARLNPTEGSEQAGVRPVIVVTRDAINRYSSVVVVVPLTSATNVKRSYPNNVDIPAGEGGLTAESEILAQRQSDGRGQHPAAERRLSACL